MIEEVDGMPARHWLRWTTVIFLIGSLLGCDDQVESSVPAQGSKNKETASQKANLITLNCDDEKSVQITEASKVETFIQAISEAEYIQGQLDIEPSHFGAVIEWNDESKQRFSFWLFEESTGLVIQSGQEGHYQLPEKSKRNLLLFLGKECTKNTANDQKQERQAEKSDPRKYNSKGDSDEEISLEFHDVPVSELIVGQPHNDLKKLKSKELRIGERDIMVELYQGSDDIYAFLHDNGRTYELGVVTSYTLKELGRLDAADVTGDGKNELLISGGMGASYVELKIIGYDAKAHRWLNLLTMGTPEIIDLDRDGKNDIIAVSAGSIHPYVHIYRWNQDHFQQSDVAKQLGNIYATLVQKDGETVIQSGTEDTKNFYRIIEGKLVKMNNLSETIGN